MLAKSMYVCYHFLERGDTMHYNIKGSLIDVSPIEQAIKSGSILGLRASIDNALSVFPAGDASRWARTLTQHIKQTGQLPSESEMLALIDGEASKVPLAPNRIHSNFPMPEKSAPACPTCHSTRLTKLTAGSRFIDRIFFGVFSPEGKAQFRCEDCGYLF